VALPNDQASDTKAPDLRAMATTLREHPDLEALSKAVAERALAAAREHNARFPEFAPGKTDSKAPELRFDAQTEWGNPLAIVHDGLPAGEAQRALIATLVCFGVKSDFPSAPETELQTARELIWLATHANLPIFECADAVYSEPEPSATLWRAVAEVAQSDSRERARSPEALVAAAAVASSTNREARVAANELLRPRTSGLVRALVESAASHRNSELRGEIQPVPRGPIATFLLSVTFVLPLRQLGRLLARFAFAYRRSATLSLGARGLELDEETTLLGRMLRQRRLNVPLANLARITREIRYARAGMYAGLAALFLGSYLGMGFFIDGLRVPGGSFSLIGLAVLFMLGGLALDFGLSSLTDDVRGKCRIVIVPKKGRKLCVGGLNRAEADAMLRAVSHRTEVDAPDTNEPEPVARAATS